MKSSASIERTLLCSAAPGILWSVLADTARLSRGLGQVPHRYTAIPTERQGETAAHFELSTKLATLALRCTDQPAEWQIRERLRLVRDFLNGPIARLETEFLLEPQQQGTTLRVRQTVTQRGDSLAFLSQLYALLSVRRLIKRLSQLDADLSRGSGLLRQVRALEPRLLFARLENARLLLPAEDAPLLDRLVEHVQGLDDLEDDAISPARLASAWDVSLGALLGCCLAAAAQDILQLQWDVVCGTCRLPALRVRRLADLSLSVVCPRCAIPVPVNLEHTTEVTFSTHASLRPQLCRIETDHVTAYAVGGPAETPHVVCQVVLEAAEKTSLRVPSEPGLYEIFVRGGLRGTLNISTLGPSHAAVRIGETIEPATLELGMGGTLEIAHEHATPRHLCLQRPEWERQAVFAHGVTLHPLFRPLFCEGLRASRQLLASGQHHPIAEVALLRTEVLGDLELIRQVGEETALRLLDEQFDLVRSFIDQLQSPPDLPVQLQAGAVVRVDREGVTGAFATSESAGLAALAIQHAFARFRLAHPGAAVLGLRIGLAVGPCHLTSSRAMLDYFGPTYSLCTRLLREAHAGDIVLSADLGTQLTAHAESLGLAVGPRFALNVRGIDAPVPVVRITVGDQTTAPHGKGKS